MADDKTNRGPADRSRVNVEQDYEVRYWTKKFDCTPSELDDAVRAVGVMATDVEAYLEKKKSI